MDKLSFSNVEAPLLGEQGAEEPTAAAALYIMLIPDDRTRGDPDRA